MKASRAALLLSLSLLVVLVIGAPVIADEHDDFDEVLINEMATRGPGGATDNFILVTNHGDEAVDASGWEIQRCNNTGTGFVGTQVTVEDGTTLEPGDEYLVAHDDGYTGDREPDATYGVSISDDGGARINDDGEILDSVGFGTNANNCTVGDPGDPLTTGEGDDGLSHHRVDDTGDNASDFEKAARSVDDTADGEVQLVEMSTRGPGGAQDNFVRIENVGGSNVDVSGWAIERCNNTGSGFVGTQVSIDDGTVLGAGEDYLVAKDGDYTGDRTPDATYGVSISDDGGARVVDGDDVVVDGVGFGTNNNNCTQGDPAEELTSAEGDQGLSHHRIDDTGDNATDFEKDARSVDDDNGNGEAPSCDDPTAISEINTVGDDGLPDTDMLDEDVAVEGVVTANFLDGLNAFFVQEPELDLDADGSQGIMVYAPDDDDDVVAVGDEVCVTGEVDEFNGTVQLSWADIDVLDSEQELPEAIDLEMPVDDRTELAAIAGMRVDMTSAEGAMTVTQNYFQGQFGELDLSATGRLWNPTELYDPHTELDLVEQEQEDNLNSWIKLDDASSEENASPTPWLENGADRAGAQTEDVIEGITHYQHGNYRVQPTDKDAIEFTNEDNPRPDEPPDVLAGADEGTETVTVAGFNVLNYFTTLGDRGASTEEEFELQAAKIVTAITKMDADVVGLMEIENNFGEEDAAIDDLVERLNDEAGEGTYDYVGQDELIGNDAISNALIYQPEEVTPVGEPAVSDQEAMVNPRDADQERNRPAVTQAFETDTGDVFVAAVNHLKSKGSGCDEEGNIGDDDEWQGNCNGTRTDSAEELVRWLEEDDPTGTGADEIAIIGDINAYAQEDPVQAILDAGYQDTLADQLGEVYTYVFDGEHGRLDHGLVSDELVDAGRLVDADVWHINVDEPAAFDYNAWNNEEDQDESEFRSSDHDPILLGLQFEEEPEPQIEAEFGDPRGRAMTVRTNVVPFSVTDAEGDPVDDADITVEVETSDGETFEADVNQRGGDGEYHARFSTDTAGDTTLTAFDADGNELGDTVIELEQRPGGPPAGGGPPGN
ncbi:ExeM/NucH family extracellular endonuclease [Egibacter rhizosphaerae]|uniref:ExeM/NucH family extracellular endonuclease n=1 Tax=Egibacter rhizosphaerae TaxID=1670831 RepID=A0A411YF35_9ACTN|nr:ExeM/NucH family extracellular endonuclease [Egibacter rhizosphaerae]QBI19863.1 ExeM/NucH family extracellular endonuclease [Egibacter rhizosphaerae]